GVYRVWLSESVGLQINGEIGGGAVEERRAGAIDGHSTPGVSRGGAVRDGDVLAATQGDSVAVDGVIHHQAVQRHPIITVNIERGAMATFDRNVLDGQVLVNNVGRSRRVLGFDRVMLASK